MFTEGVFDLLHVNHLRLLHKARAMGDRLVVGVTPDADAAAYKRRPVLTLEERMATVLATGIADEVVECSTMFGATIDAAFIARHGIGLVVYAGDGWDELYRYPTEQGIMRRIPYGGGIDSSTIIARIRNRDDL